MKITKDYLKQVIKEELDRELSEEAVEEGLADFAGRVKKVASDAKNAFGGAVKKVGDYRQSVVDAGAEAQKQSNVAKTNSKVAPMAKKALVSLTSTLKMVIGLVTTMKQLGMTDEMNKLLPVAKSLASAETALQALAPPAPAAPAPATAAARVPRAANTPPAVNTGSKLRTNP